MYLLDVMSVVTLLTFSPTFLTLITDFKTPVSFSCVLSYNVFLSFPYTPTHSHTQHYFTMNDSNPSPSFYSCFHSSFRLPRTFILSNPTPIYWNPTACKASCYTLRPLPLIFSHCRPLLIQLPVFPSDRYKVGKTKGETGQSEKTWLVIERRRWK